MEVKHQPRSFASAQFSLIITLKSIKVLALEAIWVGSSISFLNCNDLKRAFSCLHSGMDALLAEKSVFRSPRTITSCPSDNAPSNILSNRKLCCLKIRGGGGRRGHCLWEVPAIVKWWKEWRRWFNSGQLNGLDFEWRAYWAFRNKLSWNSLDNLDESQTLPSNQARYIELVVKEKIFNAILDALELQLELKLPNIGFDHI